MTAPYCERVWLNPEGHPSTGSVVAYDGPGNWEPGKNTTFLEIADCNNAVRLHMGSTDAVTHMIDKLRKLHGVVGRFLDYLEEKDAREGTATAKPGEAE